MTIKYGTIIVLSIFIISCPKYSTKVVIDDFSNIDTKNLPDASAVDSVEIDYCDDMDLVPGKKPKATFLGLKYYKAVAGSFNKGDLSKNQNINQSDVYAVLIINLKSGNRFKLRIINGGFILKNNKFFRLSAFSELRSHINSLNPD